MHNIEKQAYAWISGDSLDKTNTFPEISLKVHVLSVLQENESCKCQLQKGLFFFLSSGQD